MADSLPVLNYNRYEETAFDVTHILEGIVNGVVVFGVLSLQQAEVEKLPNLLESYEGVGQQVRVIINGDRDAEKEVMVIPFEAAYQIVSSDRLASYLKERRRVLLDRGPATAVFVHPKGSTAFIKPKHPPVPVQKPKPVPVPTVPEPKPAPVVPQSPITMTELLLQMAAMQTDFDLRMQVMAQRLAVLEAK
jgi:hypothetical protein